MLRTCDLRMKDVISMHDGRKLGSVSDIEFDLESGKMTALVVPGTGSTPLKWSIVYKTHSFAILLII